MWTLLFILLIATPPVVAILLFFQLSPKIPTVSRAGSIAATPELPSSSRAALKESSEDEEITKPITLPKLPLKRGTVVIHFGDPLYYLVQCIENDTVWCLPLNNNLKVNGPARPYDRATVSVAANGLPAYWGNVS